jgi:hypothetical protein
MNLKELRKNFSDVWLSGRTARAQLRRLREINREVTQDILRVQKRIENIEGANETLARKIAGGKEVTTAPQG